jgi:hypothetical protein
MRLIALARHTASALTIMRRLRVGRKVGCHRAVVEMFRTVFRGAAATCILTNHTPASIIPSAF